MMARRQVQKPRRQKTSDMDSGHEAHEHHHKDGDTGAAEDEGTQEETPKTKAEITLTRRASVMLAFKHRQLNSMRNLDEGGKELTRKFTLACRVNSTDDVFAAARLFRKFKTREFWNYLVFLLVFSFSTLQQRPVEQTHDFIKHVVDGTVLGNGFSSVQVERPKWP